MSDLQYAVVQTIEDGYGSKDLPETADDIIALFRDSLLSDEAVNAATRTISVEVYPGNVFLGPDAGIVREGITAALDAITGETT